MTDQEQVQALAKKEAFRNNVIAAGNLDPENWSVERLETIRKIAAPDAKNIHDLAAFLGFCEKYSLDPINGCWLLDTGKGRMGIEVSRDGWITIANRQKDFAGMDYGVVRKGEEFEIVRERGEVWVNHKQTGASSGAQIVAAYCVLYREGKRPTVVNMPWSELPTRGPVWKQQPGLMSITRVIAFAVKTAYGISAYAQGEISGADLAAPPDDIVSNTALDATRKKLEALRSPHTHADLEPAQDTPEVADEAPVAAQEPLDAEIVDEPDWKNVRAAVYEEASERGLSEEQIEAGWKLVFDGPIDGRFESAREVWASLDDPSNLATFFDVCEKATTATTTEADSDGLFD